MGEDAEWAAVAKKHLPPAGLEFDSTKKVATLWAEYRPLGVLDEVKAGNDGKDAIFVKGFTFNSYVKHMGIQEGWRIIKVDDEEVLESGPGQAKKLINSKLAD